MKHLSRYLKKQTSKHFVCLNFRVEACRDVIRMPIVQAFPQEAKVSDLILIVIDFKIDQIEDHHSGGWRINSVWRVRQ